MPNTAGWEGAEMPNKHSRRLSLRSWLAALFRQPPAGFYRTPSIYQSGNRLEVEHFRAILLYDEDRLRLQMPRGQLTICGDGLRILTLTADRLTLSGKILRVDFSDEQEA